MAVNNYTGLTISNPTTGIQITKVTDSSADWSSVANSTYFYDKTDNLVHYKDSYGNVLELFTTPSVAFSPQDVADCDTAPTAATTQYYYQTISTITGTINKVKLWGYSGTDTVLFGLYRGSLGGSMTLIGQGSATCSTGANEINLVAEAGQNLQLNVGEDIVVGYYANGISWRTIYDVGISDSAFGLINTANITTMPSTPTGTATAIRFACTLYS